MSTPENAAPSTERRMIGQVSVSLTAPARPGRVGALLYPNIFGVGPAVSHLAEDLAARGITAVVWDPYRGEPVSDSVEEMLARSRKCNDEEVVADLRHVTTWMIDEMDLSAVGGIGWCFGGRLGLLHTGTDDRVGLLCSYNPTMWSSTPVEIYGRPTSRADFAEQTLDEFDLAARIGAPVQMCQPEADHLTQPESYERLVTALRGRGAPTVHDYYPGADHGFSYAPGEHNARCHRTAWAVTTGLFTVLGNA